MKNSVWTVKVVKHCANCIKFANCKAHKKTKKDDEKDWGCWKYDGKSKLD